MSFTKLSAYVLAGTVAMTGATMLTAAPASALTPASEFRDLREDHWAFNAIKTLVEKYQVMEGFPDRTFRGAKTLTRYELAAALAKVMARVEQLVGNATGQPVAIEPGVNPEDLRTIARLQREFREELDALKARVDTIDSRVTTLEKRVKVSGATRVDYRDFVNLQQQGSTLAGWPWADFRVRNSLNLDAKLTDDLAFMGQANVDVYNPQTGVDPFLRGASGMPITDIYIPQSVIAWTPGMFTYEGGLGSIRNHMRLGSKLQDPFKMNVWGNATGGYGFAGTPGMAAPGQAGLSSLAAGTPVWLPGTNIAVDVLDPNNSQAFAPTGDLFSAANLKVGVLNFGLGFRRGALSSPYLNAGATTALPGSIPQFQTWQAGSMALANLGLDLGLMRLNLVAGSPANTALSNPGMGLNDKTTAISVDLGSDALGLSGELVANTNFSNFAMNGQKASMRLSSLNLFDTGFGVGAGLVTGTVSAAPLTGTGILAGQADYSSLGYFLKTPSFLGFVPSFTIAAQNTAPGLGAAGFSGGVIASGLTVNTEFQLWGLPSLMAEYSYGKFGVGDNLLWGASPVTAEQLTVATQFKW